MQNDMALIKRLALLMAGADFTSEETKRIIFLVSNNEAGFCDLVKQYAIDAPKASGGIADNQSYELKSVEIYENSLDDFTLGNIEKSLIWNTGWSKSEAADHLRRSLIRRFPTKIIPEFQRKEGFARWLRNVASVVPLAELLHVIATVSRVSSPRRKEDWF